MKTFISTILLFVFFVPFNIERISASCYHRHDLIFPEVLNDIQSDMDIFLIKVDTIFQYGISAGAFAEVIKVFRGNDVKKRVRITSESGTTEGGQRLEIGKKYLIVSSTKDRYQYDAFRCDRFSFELKLEKKLWFKKTKISTQEEWLAMIEHYFKLVNEKFTGEANINFGDIGYGKGQFKNGIPDGRWEYFRKSWVNDSILPKSDIFYKNGLPEGEVILYDPNINRIKKQLIYKDGKLIKEDFYQYRDGKLFPSEGLKYEFYSDEKFNYKDVSFIRLGADGNEKFKEKVFPFQIVTEIKDGPYFSYYRNLKIKEEGQFYMGAKIGTWITFDTLGREINREEFNFPDTSIAEVVFFTPEGTPMFYGNLENGKQTGEWKRAGNVIFIRTWTFKEGIKEGVAKEFSIDGVQISEMFFKNNAIHGYKIDTYRDGTLKAKTPYENNIKHGLVETYHLDGTLKARGVIKNGFGYGKILNSENGRSNEYYLYKGLMHGKFIGYDHQKRAEGVGQYYLGSKIGTWKYYQNGKLCLEEKYNYKKSRYFPVVSKSYHPDGTLENKRKHNAFY